MVNVKQKVPCSRAPGLDRALMFFDARTLVQHEPILNHFQKHFMNNISLNFLVETEY